MRSKSAERAHVAVVLLGGAVAHLAGVIMNVFVICRLLPKTFLLLLSSAVAVDSIRVFGGLGAVVAGVVTALATSVSSTTTSVSTTTSATTASIGSCI
jgi:hypothetical protein